MRDFSISAFLEGTRIFNPRLDAVFKLLFEDEELLLSMVSAVLSLDNIEHVQILNPGLRGDYPADKSLALDLQLRLSTGELVDVEMQCQVHEGLEDRVLLYWARLYHGQLKRGEAYTRLRPVHVIVWLRDNFLDSPRFHHAFGVRTEDGIAWPSNKLSIHTLELAKLGEVQRRLEREPQILLRWAKFLASKTVRELDELAKEDPIMTKAKARLEQLSADERKRQAVLNRQRDLMAWNDLMANKFAAGEARGEAKGKRLGKVEFLLDLLADIGPVSEDIREKVHAATPEQLENWRKKTRNADSPEAVVADE